MGNAIITAGISSTPSDIAQFSSTEIDYRQCSLSTKAGSSPNNASCYIGYESSSSLMSLWRDTECQAYYAQYPIVFANISYFNASFTDSTSLKSFSITSAYPSLPSVGNNGGRTSRTIYSERSASIPSSSVIGTKGIVVCAGGGSGPWLPLFKFEESSYGGFAITFGVTLIGLTLM